MKKKLITIIVIILAIIVAIVIYNQIVKNDKNYEIEKVEQYNYFVLKQDDLYGVIDKKGNTIIVPEYTEVKIPNPQKAIFVCYKEDETKILNEKNEEILKQYDHIEPIRLKNIASDLMYEKSVLKYVKDGKLGIIDFQGQEIRKPIYDEIDSLSYKEGELLVKKDEKYGVINIKGNIMVEIKYDKILVDEYYTEDNHYQNAGYIVAIKTEEGYRYGYLNNKGKEILKTEYNEISRVTEIQDNDGVYLICAKNGQYGVMKNEQSMIKNEYQSIRYDATNKVFVVEKSKRYGIVNLDGKLIVPVQYQQIDITGIYLYAQNEQGITVYNSNGTQANIDSNIAILNTSNDKYRIRINSENTTKYGVINKEGKQLIKEKYNYIEYLYDNYFIVSNENGKLGLIDDKDAVKIEIDKDSLQKIQGTNLIQAMIAGNKTVQIYNKNMQKVCEMQNAIVQIEDTIIKVYNETETRYFNKEGKEQKNTEVYPNSKLFVKIQDDYYGYVNKSGEVIVNYKYDKAYEFNEYGFAAVKQDGKWGVINEQGQEVVAPTYELKEQIEPFFIGSYYRIMYGFGEFYYTDMK